MPTRARLIEGKPDIRQYVSEGTQPVRMGRWRRAMSETSGIFGHSSFCWNCRPYRPQKPAGITPWTRRTGTTYAALHSDDYVAMSIGAKPIVGGQAAADALAIQMKNVTTVHHSHTPVIEFQDRDHATGVWAMEDNLFWVRNGEKQWLRGFGFYRENYVRGTDGKWRFNYRNLTPHAC